METGRFFWPGKLVGGVGLMYRGRICQVALDSQVREFVEAVPNGHVPVHFKAIWANEDKLCTIPLDDLEILCRRRRT